MYAPKESKSMNSSSSRLSLTPGEQARRDLRRITRPKPPPPPYAKLSLRPASAVVRAALATVAKSTSPHRNPQPESADADSGAISPTYQLRVATLAAGVQSQQQQQQQIEQTVAPRDPVRSPASANLDKSATDSEQSITAAQNRSFTTDCDIGNHARRIFTGDVSIFRGGGGAIAKSRSLSIGAGSDGGSGDLGGTTLSTSFAALSTTLRALMADKGAQQRESAATAAATSQRESDRDVLSIFNLFVKAKQAEERAAALHKPHKPPTRRTASAKKRAEGRCRVQRRRNGKDSNGGQSVSFVVDVEGQHLSSSSSSSSPSASDVSDEEGDAGASRRRVMPYFATETDELEAPKIAFLTTDQFLGRGKSATGSNRKSFSVMPIGGSRRMSPRGSQASMMALASSNNDSRVVKKGSNVSSSDSPRLRSDTGLGGTGGTLGLHQPMRSRFVASVEARHPIDGTGEWIVDVGTQDKSEDVIGTLTAELERVHRDMAGWVEALADEFVAACESRSTIAQHRYEAIRKQIRRARLRRAARKASIFVSPTQEEGHDDDDHLAATVTTTAGTGSVAEQPRSPERDRRRQSLIFAGEAEQLDDNEEDAFAGGDNAEAQSALRSQHRLSRPRRYSTVANGVGHHADNQDFVFPQREEKDETSMVDTGTRLARTATAAFVATKTVGAPADTTAELLSLSALADVELEIHEIEAWLTTVPSSLPVPRVTFAYATVSSTTLAVVGKAFHFLQEAVDASFQRVFCAAQKRFVEIDSLRDQLISCGALYTAANPTVSTMATTASQLAAPRVVDTTSLAGTPQVSCGTTPNVVNIAPGGGERFDNVPSVPPPPLIRRMSSLKSLFRRRESKATVDPSPPPPPLNADLIGFGSINEPPVLTSEDSGLVGVASLTFSGVTKHHATSPDASSPNFASPVVADDDERMEKWRNTIHKILQAATNLQWHLRLSFDHCYFTDAQAIHSLVPRLLMTSFIRPPLPSAGAAAPSSCDPQETGARCLIVVSELSMTRCINVLPVALDAAIRDVSLPPQLLSFATTLTRLSLHGTHLSTLAFTAVVDVLIAPNVMSGSRRRSRAASHAVDGRRRRSERLSSIGDDPLVVFSSSSNSALSPRRASRPFAGELEAPPPLTSSLRHIDISHCGLSHRDHLPLLCDALFSGACRLETLLADGVAMPPALGARFLEAVRDCESLRTVSVRFGDRIPDSYTARLDEILAPRRMRGLSPPLIQ